MDYEKAYKAVLETATQLIKDGCTDKERICLERVFPELRESEDEKIRKAIIELLKEVGRDDTGISENVKCMIAYLEKQKEPNAELMEKFNKGLEQAIMWGREGCKVSPNGEVKILNQDEIDDVIKKQKENPKTADSIPSDCASDAKCEDRWHKVGDSLPDNGRLVLANDFLGNILLARYDGEGNWEVSVYDNDDYYCRNTITKWCDIPSEKQKEQKPEEWSEEDEEMIKMILGDLEWERRNTTVNKDIRLYDEKIAWLKSRRPQPRKEQDVEKYPEDNSFEDEWKNYYNNSLVSRRPMNKREVAKHFYWFVKKNAWKPSEEQIYSLGTVVKGAGENNVGSVGYNLKELYEQLKKLGVKEEPEYYQHFDPDC